MKDIDDSRAPLLEHLIELRRRLLWSVAAIAVAFVVCYHFADDIFGFLVRPLAEAFGGPGQGKLVYTKLYEAFFVNVKVALFAALFVAFPVLATQLWAFVAPGLYAREKRAFLPFIIATPVLFGLGAALAYYAVMPVAFHFFLSFESSAGGIQHEALPAMGDYLSLVMHFLFAFGIAFELPVLMMLMERAGLVTRTQLVAGRRYMVVAAFVVAAVFTPPDVVSQLMLAVPLILLYEITLVVIWFTEKRRRRVAPSEPA